MPITTYTNRKGFTYFLCQGITKTGKPRYYFAREQKDKPVDEIPTGYEIDESVNGIVSLVKARPKLIAPDEVANVQAALKKHPQGRNYRVAVKHNQIIIYELVGRDADDMIESLGRGGIDLPEILRARFRADQERYGQFTPVMRFTLTNPETHEFVAERWCFRGSVDDWIYAGHSGQMDELAKKVIPALGTDNFYELY